MEGISERALWDHALFDILQLKLNCFLADLHFLGQIGIAIEEFLNLCGRLFQFLLNYR